MPERTCVVVFHESTGRSVGQILMDGDVVKELGFYLGKLHAREPGVAEELLRSRYCEWARVNGISDIRVEIRKD